MAALEGALILARAQRAIEPLDTVERFFASHPPDSSASLAAPTRRSISW